MENRANVPERPCGQWSRTRLAAARFRQLLLCSACSRLMKEPVYLGTCEHMFCRTCAGPNAGGGCIICHSPAWVKDLQINRQLSNITQLFCQLEALLNPPSESQVTSPVEPSPQPVQPAAAKISKFKIYFSPRSRKIRCRVDKLAKGVPQELGESKKLGIPHGGSHTPNDISVYSFSSSSQDSTSPYPNRDKRNGVNKTRTAMKKSIKRPYGTRRKRLVVKQTEKIVQKEKLDAINRQWGIDQEEAKSDRGGSGTETEKPGKKVSFQCPAGGPAYPAGPQPGVVQEDGCLLTPAKGLSKNSMGGKNRWPRRKLLGEDPRPSEQTTERRLSGTSRQMPRIAGPRDEAGGQRTQKRPGLPPAQGMQSGEKDQVHMIVDPRDASPTFEACCKRVGEDRSEQSTSPRTPSVFKRNHKGETPLHLAAIKGDVKAVEDLLDREADPNLKDHAGWTPLHEACNLRHLGVVAVLLQRGALANAPGYQNDTPLHDAVRNGHTDVVRLLLEHGASQSLLNTFGLRPVDCAETEEMRAVLQDHRGGPAPPSSPLSSPGGTRKVGGRSQREERVVLLGSRLSKPQQNQLTHLALVLGGQHVDTFSGSVTHLIVPGSTMPTTMSCFHGVLNGCWILRFDWVTACLEAKAWTEEAVYELGGGPLRGRVSRGNLLPPLFDGCFFFFLGSFQNPTKEDLLMLVKEGGGRVLARKPKPDSDVTQTLSVAAYHAPSGSDQALCTQYVLYDPRGTYRPPQLRLGKVWTAPSTWLLDCISAFQLLPVPEPKS